MWNKRKQLTVYIGTILFSLIFLFVGHSYTWTKADILHQAGESIREEAKVVEILDRQVESIRMSDGNDLENINLLFRARMLTGPQKGTELEALQTISNYVFEGTVEVKQGDRVILAYGDTMDESWVFIDFVRIYKVLALAVAFFAALLVFGGLKGLNTLVSLVFTVAAVFAVFIPTILGGSNVYLWTIIICLYTIVMTLLLVSGVQKKTLASATGCFAGVLLAGLLAVMMDKILALTGIVNDQALFLTYLPLNKPLDLNGIVFAGIVIGALGAVMDVSISIASSLWEVKEKAPEIDFKGLLQSGFTIGKDVMGTMANTLVLAYIGSSLSIVLLLYAYSMSMTELLNREMIIVEFLKAIIGSLGILLTMPLTSLICALLYGNKGGKTADREW